MLPPDLTATPKTERLIKAICFAAIAVGLVIRVAMVMSGIYDPDRARNPDTVAYENIASNMQEHRTFSLDPAPPLKSNLARTPGFPSFLFALRAVGLRGSAPRIIAEFLLGIGVIVLSGLLAAWIGGKLLGLIVAAIICLDPLMATFSTMVLSEMLLTLTLVLWLLCIDRFIRRPAALPALLMGVVWGLALMVKPITIVLLPIPLLVCLINRRPLGRRALWLLVCVIPMVLIPTPWILRNRAVFGTPILCSIPIHNLYFYHGAAAEAWDAGRPVLDVQIEWNERLEETARGMSPQDRLSFERHEGLRSVREHFGIYLWGCFVGVVHNAIYPVRAELEALIPRPWAYIPLLGLQMILVTILWAGVALAIFHWKTAGDRLLILAVNLVVLILLVGMATGANALARFRVPAMPMLAILGAWGWMRTLQLCAAKKLPDSATAA